MQRGCPAFSFLPLHPPEGFSPPPSTSAPSLLRGFYLARPARARLGTKCDVLLSQVFRCQSGRRRAEEGRGGQKAKGLVGENRRGRGSASFSVPRRLKQAPGDPGTLQEPPGGPSKPRRPREPKFDVHFSQMFRSPSGPLLRGVQPYPSSSSSPILNSPSLLSRLLAASSKDFSPHARRGRSRETHFDVLFRNCSHLDRTGAEQEKTRRPRNEEAG